MEGLLYEVSRTAGAAMVIALISSLCTGMIAFLSSHMPGDQRALSAFRITRVLAVFGGAVAMLGGLTGIPYHWMAGDISLQTCLIVETGLVVLTALWAAVALALMPGGRLHSR
jgi:hypothetical protein